MGKMSRDKGKRYELELASDLRQYGYNCRRGQQFCGGAGNADVIGLPGIWIEAKRRERMELYSWMDQAVHDAEKTGELPAVFHRKSNACTLVTMRLEDFMRVYNEYASGLYLKEKGTD